MAKRIVLKDIAIMRALAVVLLVLFHSLAPYNYSWKAFEGFVDIKFYEVLAYFVYVPFLAIFVFISGYVFSYQIYGRGKQYTIRELAKGKAKRLIVPALLFGVLYKFIFNPTNHLNLGFFFDLFSGVGHLWFLPMLFWCFICGWLIDKIKANEYLKITFLFLLTFLAALPDKFGLVHATRWLVFFYFGMWVYKNRSMVHNHVDIKKSIIQLLFFVVVFAICEWSWPIMENKSEYSRLWLAILYASKRLGVFLMSASVCLGVYCYLNSSKSVNSTPPCQGIQLSNAEDSIQQQKSLSKWLLLINENSFGIYIFQQFILQIIYYKTVIPIVLGPYILPWPSFFVTLLLSLLLSYVLRSTKIGRSIF